MKCDAQGDLSGQYQIHDFTDDTLAEALGVFTGADQIRERPHYTYFKQYLGSEGLEAKMIVVEKKYISRAYITDYSKYYATCFTDYPRHCDRVHFFNKQFTEDQFFRELLDPNSDFLSSGYLGCIVVKPIPDSVIGPTLLVTRNKTSSEDSLLPQYPVTQKYPVNLFGRDLEVKTLPFQEQDNAVSACTSVALWSAFHQTSQLFKTQLPSPSEISERAGNQFMSSGRIYPNDGMDISQIGQAIDSLGLVSELRVSTLFHADTSYATRLIYAYLKAGIPIILLTKPEKTSDRGHAVTIVGYATPKVQQERDITPVPEITLIADHIKDFFVHDDQVGPFAPIKFHDGTSLARSRFNNEGNLYVEQAWIHAIIIPVYPKIRIKFEDVFLTVQGIDDLLFKLNYFQYELEWDIYLTESNQFKSEILKSASDQELKKRKLFTGYPKYVWIARAQVKGNFIFDLIFDSTDSPNGFYCIDFFLHDPAAKKVMLELVEDASEFFIAYLGKDAYNRITEELKFNK